MKLMNKVSELAWLTADGISFSLLWALEKKKLEFLTVFHFLVNIYAILKEV